MNYDFAQIVKVEGSEVMVMFTIYEQYQDGKKIKKKMTGVDEVGNAYTATGVTDCNYKTNATEVTRS